MSFLQPNRIKISRPVGRATPMTPLAPQQIAGDGGYSDMQIINEIPIAEHIPASIQAASGGGMGLAKVPSDGQGRASPWRIYIRRTALAKGIVALRDVVTDEDTGQRYQVIAPYWDSFGYALRAEMLES